MGNDNFGVALAKELCWICCKEVSWPIIMNKVLTPWHKKKVEEMNGKVIGFSDKPCEECLWIMKNAFIIIGFDEEKSDLKNLPEGFYRTGHIVWVKKDIPLVTEFITEKIPGALEKGFCFMPEETMRQIWLIE